MICSIIERIAWVRRWVNAGATSLRSRRWSAPYAVNMLFTATHGNSGQSCGISPLMSAGQCCLPSFDTLGSASNRFSTSASVTDHARTPPGNSTRVTGPRARIRADSPWMSAPAGSRTRGCVSIGTP